MNGTRRRARGDTTMARPRKTDAERKRPRRLHCDDATYAELQRLARRARLPLSQYLLERGLGHALRPRPADGAGLALLRDTLDALREVAARISAQGQGIDALACLATLARIEAQVMTGLPVYDPGEPAAAETEDAP
jgi:hypothetical protein